MSESASGESESASVIETIRSQIVMKIYDEYANILRGMYSTRLNVIPSRTSPDYKDLSLLLCMP